MPRPLPEPEGWEYVRVARSGVHGRGLFAARDIPKGSPVMEYKGERLSKKEGNRRTEEQWETGRVYTFELSRRVDLDGSPSWNLARLANFSCDPNCESENDGGRRIWIKALRDIREGEEITYDYNFPLVEPPPKCRCGAASCRGYIVGSDYVKDLDEWKARKALKPERKAARRKRTTRKRSSASSPRTPSRTPSPRRRRAPEGRPASGRRGPSRTA